MNPPESLGHVLLTALATVAAWGLWALVLALMEGGP